MHNISFKISKYYLILLIEFFILAFSIYKEIDILCLIFFTVFLITPIYIHLRLKNHEASLILYFVSLCLIPQMSFPFEFNITIFKLLDGLTLNYDRLRLSHIPLISFAIIFFIINLKKIHQIKKPYILLYIISVIALFFISVIINFNSSLSILQLFIDFLYLIHIINFIIFFQTTGFNPNFSQFLKPLFYFFTIIISFDIIFCIFIPQYFPSSISYRGGIQGVLYAHELPFSTSLLFAYCFLISESRNIIISFFISLIFFYVITLTNIKSCAFLVPLVFIYKTSFKSFSFIKIAIFFIFFLLLGYTFFNNIVTNYISIGSRIGSIIVYVDHYISSIKYIIFGFAPGCFSYEMLSNIGIHFFENVQYIKYLDGIESDAITSEWVERYYYEDYLGVFLPHNVFLTLTCSYGVLGLLLTAFVFKLLIKILVNIRFINSDHVLFLLFIFVIFVLCFLHVMMLFTELIFFSYILLNHINSNKLNTFIHENSNFGRRIRI